jgi:hypothetical protein
LCSKLRKVNKYPAPLFAIYFLLLRCIRRLFTLSGFTSTHTATITPESINNDDIDQIKAFLSAPTANFVPSAGCCQHRDEHLTVQASHVIFNMVFRKQTWTLTRKNLLIALKRHFLATFIRAFALPVGYMIFLTFARNLFISNDFFGVGTGQPVRTLLQGFAAAANTRNNLVFVNSGLRYIELTLIINTLIADKKQRR